MHLGPIEIRIIRVVLCINRGKIHEKDKSFGGTKHKMSDHSVIVFVGITLLHFMNMEFDIFITEVLTVAPITR